MIGGMGGGGYRAYACDGGIGGGKEDIVGYIGHVIGGLSRTQILCTLEEEGSGHMPTFELSPRNAIMRG